jgi:hypothetical protein
VERNFDRENAVSDFLIQVAGLLLLCGLVFGGWLRWINPYEATLDTQQKGLLVLVILTIAGGAGGGVFWWMVSPISFSWQLPPLAFRMLGAAGFAFAITGLHVMHRRRASLIRDYIILLAVYLVPLVGAILLFHLDRFNWHAPITYAFFIVAGGMAAAAVWFIACRTMPPFDESPNPVPSTLVRSYLFLVMVIFGAWGLTLFIFPSGRLPQIWVWPQDALTTRLIATMLLTIGTAGLLGRSNTEAVKMSACMFVVYGFGVMFACSANASMGRPIPFTYLVAFALLALTSVPLFRTA